MKTKSNLCPGPARLCPARGHARYERGVGGRGTTKFIVISVLVDVVLVSGWGKAFDDHRCFNSKCTEGAQQQLLDSRKRRLGLRMLATGNQDYTDSACGSSSPWTSTIWTSDSELMLSTYIVTPTSTGGPASEQP